ncbi:MAG: hypothetical protein RBU45_16365 [Myxococcota bacterium]|nr:hypothetical protein [Myxococcota bacterium]
MTSLKHPSLVRPPRIRPGLWTVLSLLWALAIGLGCQGDDDGEVTGPEPGSCLRDTDCEDPTHYCQLKELSGSCQPGCRLEAGSCGEGMRCNEQHLCVEVFRPCQETGCEDRFCSAAGGVCYCDEATGRCLPGCADDAACPLPCTACDLETHQCVDARGCSQDADCPDGTYCDPTVDCGACLAGCRSYQDCPEATPFCVAHSCRNCPDCPVRCEAIPYGDATRCPADRFCNEENACELPCASDEACRRSLGAGFVCCGPGDACPLPRCIRTCLDADGYRCPATLPGEPARYCGEDGHCHDGCLGDAQCVLPERCLGGRCREGCRRDRECTESYTYCNLDVFQCLPGCSASWPCPPLQSCTERTCQPFTCGSDEDCPEPPEPYPGSYCDLGTQTCQVGCRDSSDCADANSVCDEQHICVTACRTDADCPRDRVCRIDDGLCEPGCQDDAHEPDGSPRVARRIELREGQFLDEALVLCSGDEDWSELSPDPTRSFEAYLRFDPTLGDLRLELLAGAGPDLLATAEVLTPGELLVQVASVAEVDPLLVRVLASDLEPLRGIAYALEIVQTAAITCEPDAAELPAPNDTPESARVLTDPGQYALRLCPGDADWFVLDLEEGDSLRARVSTDEDPAFRFELLASGATGLERVLLGEACDDSPGDLCIDVPFVLMTGRYYLAIPASPEVALLGAAYQLHLDLVRVHPPCADDAFEDDDGPLQAGELQDGDSHAGLRLCPDDEDWWQIELQQGDTLRLDLARDPAGDPLALEVRRGDTLVVTAPLDEAMEHLELPDLPAGSYLLRIFSPVPGGQASYDLWVSVRLESCPVDRLEPDDQPDEATPTECSALVDERVVCDGDVDYYQVQLPSLGELIARVQARSPGALDVVLLDRQGTVLAESGGPLEGVTTARRRGLPPGTYLVRVSALDGIPTRYTLQLECVPEALPCAPDALEPNNTIDRATTLELPRSGDPEAPATLELADLRICDAEDKDWFRFLTRPGDRLEILCQFFQFQGDLALELICDEGDGRKTLVATSDGQDNGEHLIFDVTTQPLCFLRVLGVPVLATGTAYSLTFLRPD